MKIPKSDAARLRLARKILARIVTHQNEAWRTDLAQEPLTQGCPRRAYQDAARFLAAVED